MNAPFKRSRWKPGDVYVVPLSQGWFGKVQAIVASPAFPNVVNVAVFGSKYPKVRHISADISSESLIALLATSRSEMNGGWWGKIGWSKPCVENHDFPNFRLGTEGVGHLHHSGSVIENLVSAMHGLLPWNINTPEDYFDRLLAPGVKRADTARILTAVELATLRQQRASLK